MKKKRNILIYILVFTLSIGAIPLGNIFAQSEEKLDENNKTIYAVSNSHLDTQWNWDVRKTISDYIPKTFKDNYKLIEKYPDYTMNFEGAFRYQLLKEYYPDLYEKLHEYMDEGRWRFTGSTYDAGDVIVPSEEAQMRNILYGNGFIEREFGQEKISNDIFLPDCFGFGYPLPTIASHMGLKGFSTQKLTWGSAYGIPFDIGLWRGPDGSELISALNPGAYVTRFEKSLSAQGSPWVDTVNKQGEDTGIYAGYAYFGTGDTGGAADESTVKVINEDVKKGFDPNTNVRTIFGNPSDFYDDLSKEDLSKLSVWDNELVMTRHGAGGYTSRTPMKRWNRHNELLANASERSSMISDYLGAIEYPKEEIRRTWERFIWHQFHDDLPGTSLPSAYTISYNDLIISLNEFSQIMGSSVASIGNAMDTNVKGEPILVYNPLERQREDVVEANVELDKNIRNIKVYDNGKEIPSQIVEKDGNKAKIKFLANMPSLGFKVFDVVESKKGSKVKTGLKVNKNKIENNSYKVKINKNGDIESIFDKELKKEILSGPSQLQLFENNSTVWPSWELMYEDFEKGPVSTVSGPAKVEVLEDGPAEVSLKITREHEGSTFEQVISLEAGSDEKRIDVDNIVDWKTTERFLKVSFPMKASNEFAKYDIGTGNIERGNNTEKLYEVPAQEWADITNEDNSFGMSILNDSKYGWDKPKDNELRLTLIQTPKGSYGANNQNVQDLGENRFTYSLYPHKGDVNEAKTDTQARRLNQKLQSYNIDKHDGKLGNEYSFLNIENSNVSINAVKMAERDDDLIIRVQELSGNDQKNVKINLNADILEAKEVNGYELEDDKHNGEVKVEGNSLIFDIGKNAPKTFKIKLEKENIGLNKIEQDQIDLNDLYNIDVYSTNENREDGGIDDEGRTIPVEILPEIIYSEGIEFEHGPVEDGKMNAIKGEGQEITIPEGNTDLYILAASVNGDKETDFIINGKKTTLTIQDYMEEVGGWDDVGAGRFKGIKRDKVAFNSSHVHNPEEDELYQFMYQFKYDFKLDDGENTIVLPDDSDIVIFAMTQANNPYSNTFESKLTYDAKEVDESRLVEVEIENGKGSGVYLNNFTMHVTPEVDPGYRFDHWEIEGNAEIEDENSFTAVVHLGEDDIKLKAVLVKLGENLALNKDTKASGYTNDREKPEFAVDFDRETKWCTTGKEQWLLVDLGEAKKITQWQVRHAGDGGETADWNTKDYRLQVSMDGKNFIDADVVKNNSIDITYRELEEAQVGRYVRLVVDKPTQSGNSAARIYEFEVYGEDLDEKDIIDVKVENGEGSGKYLKNTHFTTEAKVDMGFAFDHWEVVEGDAEFENPKEIISKVRLGEVNSTIKPIFKKLGENVAIGKDVKASGFVKDSEAPNYAVDGNLKTKWAKNSAPHWISIDLGKEYSISAWQVRHAGNGGEFKNWNTKDFSLQVSEDNETWKDVDVVRDNYADTTYRELTEPVNGRFFRLNIDKPEDYGNNAARIYEFELYE